MLISYISLTHSLSHSLTLSLTQSQKKNKKKTNKKLTHSLTHSPDTTPALKVQTCLSPPRTARCSPSRQGHGSFCSRPASTYAWTEIAAASFRSLRRAKRGALDGHKVNFTVAVFSYSSRLASDENCERSEPATLFTSCDKLASLAARFARGSLRSRLASLAHPNP